MIDALGYRKPEDWSEAEINRMIAAWKEGLSATEITKLLNGRSRGAILGKIFRIRKKNGFKDFPAREQS